MDLLEQINQLKKTSIKQIIDTRMHEFELVQKDEQKIFSELCFCILTANSTAENCICVQKEAGKHFDSLEEKELASKFKQAGCRFHTKRAGYIVEARQKKQELFENLNKLEEKELRNWLADNIKGLGMKESSHFLRNIGYKNIAIIDFHILDLLEKNNLIEKPKKLDKKAYKQIELVLKDISKRVNLNLAELDLYLWYIETGKVLK